MARFLLARAAGAAATLALVAVALHLLLGRMPAPPGGAGFGADGASLGSFLSACLRLDFGPSVREGRPVLEAALGRLGFSLLVAAPALALALVCALAAAAAAALRPGGRLDRLLGQAAFLGAALPPFFLGAFALRLLSRGGGLLPLFPTGGAGGEGMAAAPLLARTLDTAHHLALPVACLAWALAPALSRVARASLVEELAADYTVAARARGATEAGVVLGALRASLAPSIALAAPFLPLAAGHAVVLETLFGLPGLGTFIVDAVARRDLPELACATLLVALLATVCFALADLAARLADPRHGLE